MICPCKDCSNKGCGSYHDKCQAYQDFVAERDKISENKAKKSGRVPYVNRNTARYRSNHIFDTHRK